MNISQFSNRFNIQFKRDTNKYFMNNGIQQLYSSNLSFRDYPLKQELFYSSRNVVTINEMEDTISFDVRKHNYKTHYISYLTLDTNFDEIPKQAFIEVDKDKNYYLEFQIQSNNTINVTPIIVHYNNNERIHLSKIASNRSNQYIHFSDFEEKCRLTFKITGYGKFIIKRIRLISI